MMEAAAISQNDFFPDNLGDKLGKSVAVTTNTDAFNDPDRCPSWCDKKSKSKNQLFTMICDKVLLMMSLYILQDKACIRFITFRLGLPNQFI